MNHNVVSVVTILAILCLGHSCSMQGWNKRAVRYGDYQMEYKTNVRFVEGLNGSIGLSPKPLDEVQHRIVVTCKYEISANGDMVFSSLYVVDRGKSFQAKLPLAEWESKFTLSKPRLTNSGLKTLQINFPNQTIMAIDSWLLFY